MIDESHFTTPLSILSFVLIKTEKLSSNVFFYSRFDSYNFFFHFILYKFPKRKKIGLTRLEFFFTQNQSDFPKSGKGSFLFCFLHKLILDRYIFIFRFESRTICQIYHGSFAEGSESGSR